jgi:hypothetical protein
MSSVILAEGPSLTASNTDGPSITTVTISDDHTTLLQGPSGPSIITIAISGDDTTLLQGPSGARSSVTDGPSSKDKEMSFTDWYFYKMAHDDRFSNSVWESPCPSGALCANSFDRNTGETWTQHNYCNVWCAIFDLVYCIFGGLFYLVWLSCYKKRQNKQANKTLEVIGWALSAHVKLLDFQQTRTCCFSCTQDFNHQDYHYNNGLWHNTEHCSYLHALNQPGKLRHTMEQFAESLGLSTASQNDMNKLKIAIQQVCDDMRKQNYIVYGTLFKQVVRMTLESV